MSCAVEACAEEVNALRYIRNNLTSNFFNNVMDHVSWINEP